MKLSEKSILSTLLGFLIAAIVCLVLLFWPTAVPSPQDLPANTLTIRAWPLDSKITIAPPMNAPALEADQEPARFSVNQPVPNSWLFGGEQRPKKIVFTLEREGFSPKTFTFTDLETYSLIPERGSEGASWPKEPIFLESESLWASFKVRLHERAYTFGTLLLALAASFYLTLKYLQSNRQRNELLESYQNSDGDPFSGKLISEYRVQDCLGKGNYGRVYRVLVEGSQRKTEYALKIIDYSAIQEHAEHRSRFDREMELLKKINHPNVGRVIEFNRSEAYDWVLMPLYSDGTLKDRRDKSGMSYDEVLSFAKEISKGLIACHDLGIFHRDLKPENIMLDGNVAILIDFGMARGGDQKTLTMEGKMLGTPFYMAPEQAHSSRVDGKADQYAYGLILFYLLTSKLPFSKEAHDDLMALFTEKLFGRLLLLREVDPTQHEAVEAVLAKMVSREPKDRYENLEEAYQAFEEAMRTAVREGSHPKGLAMTPDPVP